MSGAVRPKYYFTVPLSGIDGSVVPTLTAETPGPYRVGQKLTTVCSVQMNPSPTSYTFRLSTGGMVTFPSNRATLTVGRILGSAQCAATNTYGTTEYSAPLDIVGVV